MHAQATSGSQNVSTFGEISSVRKLSALSTEAATPRQRASCTSLCHNTVPITTSTTTTTRCQVCVPVYSTIVTTLPTPNAFTSTNTFSACMTPSLAITTNTFTTTANTPFSLITPNTYTTANTPCSPSIPITPNTHTTVNTYNTPNIPITPNPLTTPNLPLLNTLCTKAQEDAANQNRCRWVVKNFGPYNGSSSSNNSNGNSRANLATKNKGNCCIRRRLTDEEGYIRRAACICVNKEETKVLLVSSKKDPCVWLVPGGGLEAGEEPIAAAKREAWEEAGIQGYIVRYLGLFESCHHSGLKKHRTAVYIFVVTEEHTDYPEATLGRRRQWFTLEEALLHLARNRPLQSAYLQLFMMSKLKVVAAS